MSTRKTLAKLRKLLCSHDWSEIRQGIELAVGLGDPEVNETFRKGMAVSETGDITWTASSEVARRVRGDWRFQAALSIAGGMGMLDGHEVIRLTPTSESKIVDLSGLAGLAFKTLDLSARDLWLETEDSADSAIFLAPLAECPNLETLLLTSGLRSSPLHVNLAPLEGAGLRHLRVRGEVSHAAVLGTLTELVDLDLSCTSVEDISMVARLTKLRRLDISGTGATDLTPVAAQKTLQELDVYGCDELTDLSPLSGLSELRKLRLPREGDGLDQEPLHGLTHLLEDVGMDELQGARAWQPENANRRALWTAVVATPERFASHVSLDLSGENCPHPPSWAPLARLPHLKELKLSAKSANSDGVLRLGSIAALTQLEALEITGFHSGWYEHGTIEDLAVVAELPALRSLTLRGFDGRLGGQLNPRWAHVMDTEALGRCKGLERLVLERVVLPNLAFLEHLTGLTYLSLARSKSELHPFDFSVLATLPGLGDMAADRPDTTYLRLWARGGAGTTAETLDLSGVSWPVSLEPIRGCTAIKRLSLASTEGADLRALATLTNLERLDMAGGSGDLSGILALDKLAYLDLSGAADTTTQPAKVTLGTRADVEAYQQKIARALKRRGDLTKEEQGWLDGFLERAG